MPYLDLGPNRIEYSVIKGRSRKYTYFRFKQDLTLEVVLPRGGSVDVEKVISGKSDWLLREYERLSRSANVLTDRTVMFNGRLLKINFAEGPDDQLVPDFANGVVLVRAEDPARVLELVRRWFLKESSAYVVKKVAELAPMVGARPSRVDVREIGKWGYCTRHGRLSFSWQLVALPEELREYVVLHELIHLLEFDHSHAFKRRLAKVCPDFRDREKQLNLVSPYDRLAVA